MNKCYNKKLLCRSCENEKTHLTN